MQFQYLDSDDEITCKLIANHGPQPLEQGYRLIPQEKDILHRGRHYDTITLCGFLRTKLEKK